MKILLLAPHPFFQERGTPIAVKLLIETLCIQNHEVDLLTFNEGKNLYIRGLKLFRIPKIPLIKKIPIGFSWKKAIADVLFSFYLIKFLMMNNYDVIHAVEESIFPAAFLNIFFKKRLIYDMDSSLSEQLYEKWEFLKHMKLIFNSFEKWAIKQADIIVPVCKYLAEKVNIYEPGKRVYMLEDIAFETNSEDQNDENFRKSFNAVDLFALYVGNLEHYQGIDLMLEGISLLKINKSFILIIIGGLEKDIQFYKEKIKILGIEDKVAFIGSRPLQNLMYYLKQADILISPRIKGKNTPMKIYSYLASGKVVLATNIYSHTQVLNSNCSYLVNPNSEDFADGLSELMNNESLRKTLGAAGKQLAYDNYSISSYKRKLEKIYTEIKNI